MAICGELYDGLDLSCDVPAYRPVQELKLMNRKDINSDSVVITKECESGKWNVDFSLKEGKKAAAFIGQEDGISVRYTVNKTKDDNGYTQYIHGVQLLYGGVGEEESCILNALDKGNYVAAIKFYDGQVIIVGFRNGMSTGDYDLDLVENGGIQVIEMQSNENFPERDLPYLFVPESGTAESVFDADFENAEE